jgi:stringent starvation protein B
MVHPVQSVIESLYAAGRCPRLHVDATHASVTVPDFIRQQWRERLIIDLDASYPLDLVFGEHGLAADLSFGGHVTRCSFPWEAIYIVTDRSTGRGIVLDRHVPESVKRQSAGQPPAAGLEPAVAKVEPLPEPKPELRRVDSEPAPDAAEDAEAAEAAPPAAAPAPSDDQAKKRRAAFRVIDGGG